MSLEEQLSRVITAGLNAEPELRRSLAEALGSSGDISTKAEVNYRRAENDNERCGNCIHYNPSDLATRPETARDSGSCAIVSGGIYSGDVCDEWKSKPTDDGNNDNAPVDAGQNDNT